MHAAPGYLKTHTCIVCNVLWNRTTRSLHLTTSMSISTCASKFQSTCETHTYTQTQTHTRPNLGSTQKTPQDGVLQPQGSEQTSLGPTEWDLLGPPCTAAQQDLWVSHKESMERFPQTATKHKEDYGSGCQRTVRTGTERQVRASHVLCDIQGYDHVRGGWGHANMEERRATRAVRAWAFVMITVPRSHSPGPQVHDLLLVQRLPPQECRDTWKNWRCSAGLPSRRRGV